MDEVGVEHLQRRMGGQMLQRRLAHAHQGQGAQRREVEPADDLLPWRFRSVVQHHRRLGVRLGLVGLDGLVEALRVRPEAAGQGQQEIELAGGVERRPAGQDLDGHGHAGGLALALDQAGAEGRQVGRGRGGQRAGLAAAGPGFARRVGPAPLEDGGEDAGQERRLGRHGAPYVRTLNT
ncbi:MAG: hypothetical protein WDN45_03470 [Caulobacteraceae bacterium]